MYRIFADSELIFDSTLEDYKIGQGQVTRELDKSGSFVFSLFPDHPYYNGFTRMKTVVTVYKSGRIAFRGRVLHDEVDYWNNKVLTCGGELDFLQDSVVRPFEFQGTPADLFKKFIEDHNAQVDEFKRFKVGTVDIQDENDYINRSSTGYGATLATMTNALTGSALGGHIYITHGDDGTDPVPTIHYLKDFTKVATQDIEFGANLKDYTKKTDAADIATAIIPLGTETGTEGQRLTIADVNAGKDFVYSEAGVALYGWVFKTVTWEDVTLAQNLLTKARAYLEEVVNQNVTIELNAIDLHLLDRSVESFNVCEYVRVRSKPHSFDAVLLCNKQTLDLLKPENDTVVLGYQTTTLTGATVQMANNVSILGKQVSSVKQTATSIELQVKNLDKGLGQTLRVGADGVTITNAAGDEVSIDGGQIMAGTVIASVGIQSATISGGTMNISDNFIVDEAGNLTINGNINLSGGSITWGGNAPSTGISASRCRTIISEELVASPNIAGGKFWDLDQTTWLEMDTPNNSVAYLHQYAEIYSTTEPVCAMGYYSTGSADEWVLAPFNKIRLGYSDTYDMMYGTGSWDFSQAEVAGLYLRFS